MRKQGVNPDSQRIRGRAAVELRRRRLEAEPLCRDCLARGIVRASAVPDHITPLALGGVEDGMVGSPNIRCLCDDCHRDRTAEQFGHRRKRPVALNGWDDSLPPPQQGTQR
jgi:5-methylcytosine-specific restriction protein A